MYHCWKHCKKMFQNARDYCIKETMANLII